MASNTGGAFGIVIPTYNEGESIAHLLVAIRKTVPNALVVVVDDSPGMETIDAVKKLNDPYARFIKRTKKGGRGSAVLDGLKFLASEGCQRFIEMDADFSHPPTQIPEILESADGNNADLLIASRYLSTSRIENWPLSRRIFSRLANWLAKRLLSVPVHDYTNGYRYYSRRAADLIVSTCGQRGTGFIALSEILVTVYYSKLRVVEIPTVFINRLRGESSLNHKEILNAVKGLLKIYSLKREMARR